MRDFRDLREGGGGRAAAKCAATFFIGRVHLHEAMAVAVKSAHDARIYNGNDATPVSYIHLNTKKTAEIYKFQQSFILL